MNIYLVEANDFDSVEYEECNGFVAVASTADEAVSMQEIVFVDHDFCTDLVVDKKINVTLIGVAHESYSSPCVLFSAAR